MDDAQAGLTWRERSALQQIDEELSRQDPQLAASLADLSSPHDYRWPAVFRMSVRFYLALGLLLLVTAAIIHHGLSFLMALVCFGAALARANLKPVPGQPGG